jgi:hypothetical protein
MPLDHYRTPMLNSLVMGANPSGALAAVPGVSWALNGVLGLGINHQSGGHRWYASDDFVFFAEEAALRFVRDTPDESNINQWLKEWYPAPLPVPVVEPGLPFPIPGLAVEYEFDIHTLPVEKREEIRRDWVAWVKKHGPKIKELGGIINVHSTADDWGSKAYNNKKAKLRTLTAYGLLSGELPPDLDSIVTYSSSGEDFFFVQADSKNGNSKNRLSYLEVKFSEKKPIGKSSEKSELDDRYKGGN